MKFIISESTVNTFNAQVHLALKQEGASQSVVDAFVQPMTEVTDLTNMSITLAAGERIGAGPNGLIHERDWVIEVNDEILFKYLRIYIKVGKFIASIVTPFKGLMSSLEVEFNSISTFITQRK